MTALRAVALFTAYGAIGFGGDYAVGLLDRDYSEVEVRQAPKVAVGVSPAVIVDVLPTIVARVQIHHGGSCDFEVDREFTMSTAGVTLLNIDAGAGALHVEGHEGLGEIIMIGRVCTSDEDSIDDL